MAEPSFQERLIERLQLLEKEIKNLKASNTRLRERIKDIEAMDFFAQLSAMDKRLAKGEQEHLMFERKVWAELLSTAEVLISVMTSNPILRNDPQVIRLVEYIAGSRKATGQRILESPNPENVVKAQVADWIRRSGELFQD